MPKNSKADQELEMWRTWKSNPSPATLEPLLDSLKPVISRKVAEFRAAPVPPAAIQGMATTAAVKALNTYDPNRGAGIHTHVHNYLKKTRTFVIKHQNVGRIPDHRAYNIGRFKAAVSDLEEKYGYVPDSRTIAESMGWSRAEVGRMESELRKDLITSKSLEADHLWEMESEDERDALRYIHQDLSSDERTVFEYSLGINGKPKLSAGEIATMMHISQPKVSRIRRKIDKKLAERGV